MRKPTNLFRGFFLINDNKILNKKKTALDFTDKSTQKMADNEARTEELEALQAIYGNAPLLGLLKFR